jgi:hypothetical protein
MLRVSLVLWVVLTWSDLNEEREAETPIRGDVACPIGL